MEAFPLKADKYPDFHEYVHDFFCNYLVIRRNASSETIRAYKQAMKEFRNYLQNEKNIPFSKVTFQEMEQENLYDFRNYLRDRQGLAPASINARMAGIRSFLKYAGNRDVAIWTLYKKAADIHPEKNEVEEPIKYLTTDQVSRLVQAPDLSKVKGRRDQFMMLFCYETGARRQELLDLRVGDIRAEKDFLRVRIKGKGGKVRWVPVVTEVRPKVDAYLEEFHERRDSDEFLFYTLHRGVRTQMSPGTFQYMLDKYAAQIRSIDDGFPESIHPHILRHSIAMAMYKSGVPISYIREFLGHSSVSTTQVYARADAETLKNALESVPHLANKQPPRKKWKENEQELLAFCGLD